MQHIVQGRLIMLLQDGLLCATILADDLRIVKVVALLRVRRVGRLGNSAPNHGLRRHHLIRINHGHRMH